MHFAPCRFHNFRNNDAASSMTAVASRERDLIENLIRGIRQLVEAISLFIEVIRIRVIIKIALNDSSFDESMKDSSG